MATYSEDEWADIRATGTPGPRHTPPVTVADTLDDTSCRTCGHDSSWHDLGADTDTCKDPFDTDRCPCARFEPAS